MRDDKGQRRLNGSKKTKSEYLPKCRKSSKGNIPAK